VDPVQPDEIRTAVEAALREDIREGDATTLSTVPASSRSSAVLRAREPLTVAGIGFAVQAFRSLSPEMSTRVVVGDGHPAGAQDILLEVAGSTRTILSAERVALNFVQRLSGIATLTARFVAAVAGTKAAVLDTRKTTPGWRRFEKHAVVCGGGRNHRFGLFDMILIKDNHLAALKDEQPNPIACAVRRAREACPDLKVEVEADDLNQVAQATEAGADFILLDNMGIPELEMAVRMVGGRSLLEASGGVTIETIGAIARTGVDFISVGALTHSAPAVDIGLDFER